jgi:1-pyrroline-4-hydroxy-2-carboxylate deaminase
MIVHWQGIYAALLTPFTADNTLDREMFTLNLNIQLDAGKFLHSFY